MDFLIDLDEIEENVPTGRESCINSITANYEKQGKKWVGIDFNLYEGNAALLLFRLSDAQQSDKNEGQTLSESV